jgi:hypothetical protein
LTRTTDGPGDFEIKIMLTLVAVTVLAAGQIFAHCGTFGSGGAHVDKDGCVKGKPCKCIDCVKTCGSKACKATEACKDDGC